MAVLATRNRPSVIYPETMLTFESENAVAVNLALSPGAYRYVSPDDYAQPTQTTVVQEPRRRTYVYGGGYYGPYYDPFYYPYWGGWGGWGSGIYFGTTVRVGPRGGFRGRR